jgi:hypothetical protein
LAGGRRSSSSCRAAATAARYFDLPVPGYSQAEHHARQGTVVNAVDYLGAGDSSAPRMEVSTLPAVAASHAAISDVLGLRQARSRTVSLRSTSHSAGDSPARQCVASNDDVPVMRVNSNN